MMVPISRARYPQSCYCFCAHLQNWGNIGLARKRGQRYTNSREGRIYRRDFIWFIVDYIDLFSRFNIFTPILLYEDGKFLSKYYVDSWVNGWFDKENKTSKSTQPFRLQIQSLSSTSDQLLPITANTNNRPRFTDHDP